MNGRGIKPVRWTPEYIHAFAQDWNTPALSLQDLASKHHFPNVRDLASMASRLRRQGHPLIFRNVRGPRKDIPRCPGTYRGICLWPLRSEQEFRQGRCHECQAEMNATLATTG